MAKDDAVIQLAFFVKLEFPDGDVRLSDGGFLRFASDGESENYEADHPVFGTIHDPDEAEDSMGDMAEGGSLVLAPNPEAVLGAWWRQDLFDCRVRIWMGEIAEDGFTVTTAQLLRDYLVDSYERIQRADGDLLALEFISRTEKLFLLNRGNVCSDRFHQTVFPGERGFVHCTDLTGFKAWGAQSPPRSAGRGSGGSGGFNVGNVMREMMR